MTSFYPHDYEGALECLLKARDPYRGRPISSNTRLVSCMVGDVEAVGVKYHYTVVVAFMPNGNVVLNSGGWRTVTTMKRFRDYAPHAHVSGGYRYNVRGEKVSDYKTWLVHSSPMATTPPKVQKCRARGCKGTGKYSVTDAGHWNYENSGYIDGVYTPPVFEKYDTPKVTWHECWRCKGTGQVDYGSKPVVPTFEDGVVIDQRGFVVGYGPAPREAITDAVRRPSRPSTRASRLTSGLYNTTPSTTPYDAETVRFNEVSDAAHAEMLEWMR